MFLKELIKNYISAFKLIPAFTPWGFHSALSFARKENEIFTRLVNDPCEEYAIEYIEHRKNKPAFSFTFSNHPSVWARVREKWHIINKSDRISYEMKKAIMNDLMGQGLYLNNQKKNTGDAVGQNSGA